MHTGDFITMKSFKFRYVAADGALYYKNVTLPADAVQLVGYDANGTEVYEDDTVIGDDGAEWIVGLTSCVTSDEGFTHDIPLEFFTLKEADQ